MVRGVLALVAAATLAACGGAGAGAGLNPTPITSPSPVPTSTVSSQQVVRMALPSTAIGSIVDPRFGLIGGYTQTLYSQTLAFVPGSQIVIANVQAATIAHTFNVVSTTAFFPDATLSTTPSRGSTIGAGFASGSVARGAQVGPFTLVAGIYYIGCAFHYVSNTMRTVLNVAPNATPGPQATPRPQATAPPSGNGY